MCGKNQSTGRTKGPWESAIFMSGEVTRKLLPIKSTGWTRGGGGGVDAGFQVTGMIDCGPNAKPKKSLGLPTKPKKFPAPEANP